MDRFIDWCKFGLIEVLVIATLRYLLPSPESIFSAFIFSSSALFYQF
ncbi:hypothetical protein NXS11_02915 [Staphylococcus sp. GRT3]|uniref:Uncharacterized protein n=1 Tax=Staphylococcus americanisciuri TaxID=2973940 RepID=A0ABT2F071_9STAP|nr:hypothetical protein [Staphylococcus americanisciuri]